MRIDRRTFIGAALGTPFLAFHQAAGSSPPWVPVGFPAFYEDEDFGHLIVHKDVDLDKGTDYRLWQNNGGDTAQREGLTWFAIWFLEQERTNPVARPTLAWADAIKLLESPNEPGTFWRHPNPARPDWSATSNFSRDQQSAIVAALGALGPVQTLDRLWTKFDGRGRRCQNGDTGGPDHQNLFFRARRQGTLESFGEFQLAMMVESISARGAGNRDDVGDDLNFMIALTAAHTWRPTRTSAAALCEYLRTRPINFGCYLERYRRTFRDFTPGEMVDRIEWLIRRDSRPECHPAVGALRWYFRTESGAGWGPASLWEQVLAILAAKVQCVASRDLR